MEVEGKDALAFAKKNNASTDARIKSDVRYQSTYDDIFKIVSAKDKLPVFSIINDEIYNFWQDDVHVKGILRKSTAAAFNSGKPVWKTIIDVDLLAKTENENWVYKNINCLDPDFELCLVGLSRGGKDAVVIREFNLKTQKFAENGFYIPESKSDAVWYNADTLLVGDGTDPSTLTTSGYPSRVKVLKRGAELKNAPVIFEGSTTSMGTWVTTQLQNNQRAIIFINQVSFFAADYYSYNFFESKSVRLPIPQDADFKGFFKGNILFLNRSEFLKYPAGSLLSTDFNEASRSNNPEFLPVFIPTKIEFFEGFGTSKNSVWVSTLKDVKKQVYQYQKINNKWTNKSLNIDTNSGNTDISAFDEQSHHIYLSYSDFLTPTSIYHIDDSNKIQASKVLQAPARFNSSTYKISQLKVKSKDGTQVPFFIVYPKSMSLSANKKARPTLLYAYGGFEIASTQNYLGATGKVWLEKGGVYVVANIRGGGEYGPAWHKSALKQNRHKAYEDFYAVAEDLIKRKITTPRHLGIKGGSNGGLLTSVALTQRPELFNAVISEVPLANMLEYHQWLAGASWMEEYGDPDEPNMRKYLESYSPLHNLSKDKKYPEVFFLTSTKDDRVHPAHARQMVARMQELGHPVLYNENTDGGHGRASNMKDLAEFLALEFTYLYQKLF
ncbi:MAG: prolyl oligopeptidase family serine peptidase [Pseudobdellovibrio sp.]